MEPTAKRRLREKTPSSQVSVPAPPQPVALERDDTGLTSQWLERVSVAVSESALAVVGAAAWLCW